jgi:hypothetical protein
MYVTGAKADITNGRARRHQWPSNWCELDIIAPLNVQLSRQKLCLTFLSEIKALLQEEIDVLRTAASPMACVINAWPPSFDAT